MWSWTSISLIDGINSACVSVRISLLVRRIFGVVFTIHSDLYILQIRGLIIAPGNDTTTFLVISRILWDASMSDPRPESAALVGSQIPQGKLHGKFKWSFSIDLPSEVCMSDRKAAELGLSACRQLPPSLAEIGSVEHAKLVYKLTAEAKRKGTFKGAIK